MTILTSSFCASPKTRLYTAVFHFINFGGAENLCGKDGAQKNTGRGMFQKMKIRKANVRDVSRIAEILVFVKRMNYRAIFHNDDYSFNELQVLSVAKKIAEPEMLDHIWVYDDGIVKAMIHVDESEIKELYVDHFFQGEGIGAKLIEFAKSECRVRFLWVLEKNSDAIRFYERNGFHKTNTKKIEAGTTENILLMEC